MAFIESPRFPDTISYGSAGGPNFSTDVITVKSGFEVRNSNWAESRHSYNASLGVRTEAQLVELIEYFQAMGGRANTFRFKDWLDYNSATPKATISNTDQTIGSGDGATTDFQLVKNYTKGLTYQRDIKKPVTGTTIIAIDGVSHEVAFSVATSTGIVTITDISRAVTNAVSSGGNTILTFSSATHSIDDSVHLSGFTGDWAALNGARYSITNNTGTTTLTFVFDSSTFTAYSANGGQIETLPQSGESVSAGFEFDVPVRFDTDQLSLTIDDYSTGSSDAPLIEVKI